MSDSIPKWIRIKMALAILFSTYPDHLSSHKVYSGIRKNNGKSFTNGQYSVHVEWVDYGVSKL